MTDLPEPVTDDRLTHLEQTAYGWIHGAGNAPARICEGLDLQDVCAALRQERARLAAVEEAARAVIEKPKAAYERAIAHRDYTADEVYAAELACCVSALAAVLQERGA